jgi:hypothetical protein
MGATSHQKITIVLRQTLLHDLWTQNIDNPEIIVDKYITGTVSRDFRPLFFRQTKPLGPLIHGLKRFRIQIRIRGDIRLRQSTPRAVLHSTESIFLDNHQFFNFILLPWGRQDHLWPFFVTLLLYRMWQKHEHWCFDSALCQKNSAPALTFCPQKIFYCYFFFTRNTKNIGIIRWTRCFATSLAQRKKDMQNQAAYEQIKQIFKINVTHWNRMFLQCTGRYRWNVSMHRTQWQNTWTMEIKKWVQYTIEK